jgi:hypothetical protein
MPSLEEAVPGGTESPEVGRADSSNDKSPAEPSQTTDSPIGIFDDNVTPSDKPPEKNQVSTAKAESASSSTYGPLRRVRQKDGPPALYRPPAMHADDFAEMMREVVPQLLEEATQSIDQSMHPKRRLENPDSSDEPAGHRPRTGAASEVLSVQDVNHLSEMMTDDSTSIETLVAHYMQRHNTKEMPPCNKSSRGSTIG